MDRWLPFSRRLAIAVLTLTVATTAEGQEVARFDQLGSLLGPGDSVSVTDTSGGELAGRITSLSASSLSLVINGREREMSEDDVAAIRQRHRDSLKNGALWGLVSGGAFAATLSVLMWEASDDAADAIGFVASYAGLGTAIGIGVDALITGRRTLYQRPKQTGARYSVAPMLTATRHGVLVSASF